MEPILLLFLVVFANVWEWNLSPIEFFGRTLKLEITHSHVCKHCVNNFANKLDLDPAVATVSNTVEFEPLMFDYLLQTVSGWFKVYWKDDSRFIELVELKERIPPSQLLPTIRNSG